MVDNDENSQTGRSYKRLLLGIFVLFVVDVIWVLSAELTEYIFHDSDFNKPFFSTYLKTSLLSMYLFGILFVRRWRFQLVHVAKGNKPFEKTLRDIELHCGNRYRQYINDAYDEQRIVDASEIRINVNGVEVTGDIDSSLDEVRVREHQNVNQEGSESQDEERSKASDIRLDDIGYVKIEALRRMSDAEIKELKDRLVPICKKLSFRYTVFLALLFVILWMCANLMYQEALSKTSAAVTNILSSTSGIFTLLLAAVFPSSITDRFSVSKFLAVLISFGGIFLVCWTDPSREDASLNIGDIYALLGAIFYACYLVLVRKKAGDEGNLDIPLFLGFVGLFGLLLFWPMFLLLDYAKFEVFEFPEHKMTWAYLILNGVIGTAISELLWLWGCFLTSSLMATLALGFVLPLTMIWDILVNHIRFSKLFFAGTVPIVLCFIAVGVLTHYGDWDPVKELFTNCVCCKRQARARDRKKRYAENSNECGCSSNQFQMHDG